ncbi:MAG: hypothetical protein K6F68_06290 [Clostridiales bacterium]|nr:hypothetical protein [Clostridiales bacterium]
MDMRALYPVSLPTERLEGEDEKTHYDVIKKNESCLNMNFSLLAEKIYELEIRLAILETAADD